MAISSYATVSDLTGTAGYLRDPSATANSAILNTFCAVASRFLDEMFGGGGSQFFYDDGYYFQPIDSQGQAHIDPRRPFFFSSGTIASASKGATSLTYTPSALAPSVPQINDSITLDVGSSRETLVISGVSGAGPTYTLTVPATAFAHAASTLATTIQIELRYFENQPQNQVIVTLDGDGVNPPSNFFVWPRERPRVGATNQSTPDTTSRWPWRGIDISHIPISSTTFLPSSIPGYLTVRVAAHWGWPVVPDLVKDLTCKLAVRLWRKRQAGEGDIGGAADAAGMGNLRELFDALDEAMVLSSGYKVTYI